MSASLANSATLYDDVDFRNRVRAAMVEYASTILSSATIEGTIAERMLTTRLALRVVADADAHVPNFARLVADNASVSAQIDPAVVPDGDIKYVVQSLWTSVAASIPTL